MTPSKPNWALLGGLRFFLALLVAGFHLNTSAQDGNPYLLMPLDPNVAVDVFFIVSGFSIHASYSRDASGFYRRRFWRVAPLYWCGVLLAYASFLIWGPHIALDFGAAADWPGWPTFFYHLFGLQPLLGGTLVFNGSLWSLGVEIVFYACVPLIARLKQPWLLAAIFASALLTTTVPRAAHALGFNALIYAHCFWVFGLGWLFYGYRSATSCRWGLIVFATGIIALEMHTALGWALMLGGSSVIAFSDKMEIGSIFEKAGDYLGDLSFPFYALHWPVGWILNFMRLNWPMVYTMPVALAVAVLALHLIDRPLRGLGRTRSTRDPLVDSEAEVMAAN